MLMAYKKVSLNNIPEGETIDVRVSKISEIDLDFYYEGSYIMIPKFVENDKTIENIEPDKIRNLGDEHYNYYQVVSK